MRENEAYMVSEERMKCEGAGLPTKAASGVRGYWWIDTGTDATKSTS